MVAEGLDPPTTPARYYLAYIEEYGTREDAADDAPATGQSDIEVMGGGG